jgi:type VI secretion system secreted protein Hcp
MYACYLKLTGVSGEAIDPTHRDWIDIISFNWGETRSGARPGTLIPGSAKPQFQSVKLYKRVDVASPQLMIKCARDAEFSEAVIDVQTQAASPTVVYRLRLVTATLASLKATFDGDMLGEELSFIFQKMELAYVRLKADGSPMGTVKSAYDLARDTTYVPSI